MPNQKIIRSSGVKGEEWLLPNIVKGGSLHMISGKPKCYITETLLEKLAIALNKETENCRNSLTSDWGNCFPILFLKVLTFFILPMLN